MIESECLNPWMIHIPVVFPHWIARLQWRKGTFVIRTYANTGFLPEIRLTLQNQTLWQFCHSQRNSLDRSQWVHWGVKLLHETIYSIMVCVHVCVCICVGVRVWVCVYVHACVFILSTSIFKYICINVCVCLCHKYAFVCHLYTRMHMCKRVCVQACPCASLSLC